MSLYKNELWYLSLLLFVEEDCEATFEDILMFATGVQNLPPLGNEDLSIDFQHETVHLQQGNESPCPWPTRVIWHWPCQIFIIHECHSKQKMIYRKKHSHRHVYCMETSTPIYLKILRWCVGKWTVSSSSFQYSSQLHPLYWGIKWYPHGNHWRNDQRDGPQWGF